MIFIIGAILGIIIGTITRSVELGVAGGSVVALFLLTIRYILQLIYASYFDSRRGMTYSWWAIGAPLFCLTFWGYGKLAGGQAFVTFLVLEGLLLAAMGLLKLRDTLDSKWGT
ncbi:hypothetical protein JNJ66_06045 [Candidatus Saccharibacteria bacterium]|nr:hypothetical protein [Candidatus Saccharibacteria bacterium]